MAIKLFRLSAALILTSAALSIPLEGQRLPIWHLKDAITLAPDHDFSNVYAMVALPNGELLVDDTRNEEVCIIGKNGTDIRSIGRNGSGPGEFTRARAVGTVADTIWLMDSQQGRTSFFSSSGKFLSSIRRDVVVDIISVMAGGSSIATSTSTRMGSPNMFKDERQPVLIVRRNGQARDTAAWLYTRNQTFSIQRADGTYTINSQPFSDASLLIPHPRGTSFYIVDRAATSAPKSTFSVTQLAPGGDTVWTRKFPYTAVRVPPSRIDSLRKARERSLLRTGISQSQINDALFTPAFYPPVSDAIVSTEGTLWLRREQVAGTVDVVVVGPAGKPIASLKVPANFKIMAVNADDVYGVIKDADDIPFVVRYHIAR